LVTSVLRVAEARRAGASRRRTAGATVRKGTPGSLRDGVNYHYR
jgi:hypothetical protein